MRVPEDIRKCVGFVGFQEADGSFKLCGSCFFVYRERIGFYFQYIITARHVIDGIKGLGIEKASLRLNLPNGSAKWYHTLINDWIYHDAGSSVDVSAYAITLPISEIDHNRYPLASAATEEIIQTNQIGIGEEIFLAGLFTNHGGKNRNIPVVRAGNIAAMPEEKIATSLGEIDAYLIEARSIGGFSGSPVFVYLGITRIVNGVLKHASTQHGVFFLLGLMHGHFTQSENNENTGIGIVVPVQKILEILDQKKAIDIENRIASESLKNNS